MYILFIFFFILRRLVQLKNIELDFATAMDLISFDLTVLSLIGIHGVVLCLEMCISVAS